ncbi:DUF418 domain-containing protein [Virgibacillus ainsalahensis]
MNNDMKPLKERNRLQWIDAARGFAIFGIFIVNVGSFSAPYFMYGGEGEAWTTQVDQWTLIIIDIFFQASFYTLFSILFGFGIQIMKERVKQKGIHPRPFLFRRLLILIGFGLIHAFLIWHGDILLSYGMIGLLLLLFLEVKGKTLLIWGISLLCGSVGFFTFLLYASRNYLDFTFTSEINQAMNNYQSSNITDIWSQNYNDWMFANGGMTFFILAFMLLPLFLFGMYLAKKRILHQPVLHKRLLIQLWLIALALFVLLKLGPYTFNNPAWFSYIQDNIGGTASALFYILSITLLAQSRIGYQLMKPFTYVGRMALSNYIMQSIMSFILFYGIGFSLYGSIRPITGVLLVVIIFSLQVLLSKWWFSHFLFGPLEWVWRCLTYGKKQPLRRRQPVRD